MSDTVDAHIIEVTQHDRDDIVVGRQYIVLFLEDASADRLISSTVSDDL